MLTVGDGGDGGFSHSRRCRVKCSLCLPLVMVVTVVSPTPDVVELSVLTVCLPLVMVVTVVSPTPDVVELSVLCAYRW